MSEARHAPLAGAPYILVCAAGVGLAVAGIAFVLTGKHHR